MELVHFDFVFEELWNSEIDFVLEHDRISLCYKLSFVSHKVGVLCRSGPDLAVWICRWVVCKIEIVASMALNNSAFLCLYYCDFVDGEEDPLFFYNYYNLGEISSIGNLTCVVGDIT